MALHASQRIASITKLVLSHPRNIFLFFVLLVTILTLGSALHPPTRSTVLSYAQSFKSQCDVPPNPPSPPTPEPPKDPYAGLSHHEKIIAMGPPHYEAIKEYEKNLPQHNLNNPFPEGTKGRYVKFSNQIKLLGWNNCLGEELMNAHLAYASNRAYVFSDYWWATEHYPWPKEKQLDDYPRTPLNAILAGPIAGGLWEANDSAPRSISDVWWDTVCPQNQRRIINTREIKPPIMDAQGTVIFDAWLKALRDAPELCIEVQGASEDSFSQTFDLRLWGSPNLLSLWEMFVKSPTSRLLKPSPLVNSAVDRNEYLFFPRGPRPPAASHNVWDRVLSMHVRRGDYLGHCTGVLVAQNMTFYGWSQLPSLPDRLRHSSDPEENKNMLLPHCLPSVTDIAVKARQARAEYTASGKGRVLDVVYLLTNDKTEFVEELISSMKLDGWTTIRTSRELVLDQEQTDVSMAVDMEIAGRSAVFVGNGWSSYTSNIVHRRLKEGKEPSSVRFF